MVLKYKKQLYNPMMQKKKNVCKIIFIFDFLQNYKQYKENSNI